MNVEPLEIHPSIPAPSANRDKWTVEAILSLIHISEPTRRRGISYAVFCLKKKKRKEKEEVRRGGGGGGGVFFFF